MSSFVDATFVQRGDRKEAEVQRALSASAGRTSQPHAAGSRFAVLECICRMT